MVPYFAVGYTFFWLIFMIMRMVDLMELLLIKQVGGMIVFKIFMNMQPFIFATVAPLAILVSILMAFGRLSSDSEVVALMAAGTSHLQLLKAPLLLGILSTIILIWFNDQILPRGNYAYKEVLIEIRNKKPIALLQEKQFVKIENGTISVDRIDARNNKLYGIMIYSRNPSTQNLIVQSALEGQWLQNRTVIDSRKQIYQTMQLELLKGTWHEYDADGETFDTRTFDRFIKSFKYRISGDVTVRKQASEMTLRELRAFIKEERQQSNPKILRRLKMDYNKKVSIPFAAFAFIILGVGVALIPKKAGVGYGLGVSLIIMIVYYIFFTVGEFLGKSGTLNPAFAMWYTDIIIALGGAVILYKVTK